MEHKNIRPEKITKPIQLLAVWLLGLILLVSALITASATVKQPSWLPAFYGISSVCIIPVFLILIFLLQTRFRPQMQEDEYYSKYLNKDTQIEENDFAKRIIDSVTSMLDEKIVDLSTLTKNQISDLNRSVDIISAHINQPLDREKLPAISGEGIRKFESFISDAKTTVQVNIKLPSVDEIVTFLKSSNIKIDRYFGEHEKHEIPQIFLLSFGSKVDLSILQFLVVNLKPYGLTHLRTAENEQGSIYIGSYAYKRGNKMALLDSGLIEKIKKAESTQEVYAYVFETMTKA